MENGSLADRFSLPGVLAEASCLAGSRLWERDSANEQLLRAVVCRPVRNRRHGGLPPDDAEGRPELLEPIMKVDVYIPDANVGDVIGDLNRRRSHLDP